MLVLPCVCAVPLPLAVPVVRVCLLASFIVLYEAVKIHTPAHADVRIKNS